MKNIYVGNLSFTSTESEIEKLFSQHGEVSAVKLITDPQTGRSRGFSFVEMPNDDEAEAAIAALNNYEMDGRPLKVNEARPREDRPRGGGGGGDRRGGGGRGGYGDRRGGGGGGGRGYRSW